MKVAIIGGGAAGFFAAIHVRGNFPESEVYILEKSKKLLAKVKVSGGGRCNVTNGAANISTLSKGYPRGEKQLKKAFGTFNNHDVMSWFETRGVKLVIQPDNCVFPVSQNSQTIINCFLEETNRLGVEIRTSANVKKIEPLDNEQLRLIINDEAEDFNKVIVATGGMPKRKGLEWLADLGHEISDPVPSLFTFNMPTENVTDLMGIVVEETLTRVEGTKLKSDGPLLITHWGMSGPSILKLSAFGARVLSEIGYKFKVQVNWVNEQNVSVVESEVLRLENEFGAKQLGNIRPYYLPDRLWRYMLDKAGLSPDKKWGEIGKKGRNKILHYLTNDTYEVSGKTTFKEEFVTCGGVALKSIDFKTMESKVVKNLYFAGELLDIDGITGGYNFQAAWTTAYLAARLSK